VQFKLFLILLSATSIQDLPTKEFESMEACKEVKAFYEGVKTTSSSFRAYCLDDGSVSEPTEETK
jgi:hypothetical protein